MRRAALVVEMNNGNAGRCTLGRKYDKGVVVAVIGESRCMDGDGCEAMGFGWTSSGTAEGRERGSVGARRGRTGRRWVQCGAMACGAVDAAVRVIMEVEASSRNADEQSVTSTVSLPRAVHASRPVLVLYKRLVFISSLLASGGRRRRSARRRAVGRARRRAVRPLRPRREEAIGRGRENGW